MELQESVQAKLYGFNWINYIEFFNADFFVAIYLCIMLEEKMFGNEKTVMLSLIF